MLRGLLPTPAVMLVQLCQVPHHTVEKHHHTLIAAPRMFACDGCLEDRFEMNAGCEKSPIGSDDVRRQAIWS